MLDSAAEGVYQAALAQYQSIAAYLRWEDKGVITISGMTDKGSMKDSPRLKDVYEMGRAL